LARVIPLPLHSGDNVYTAWLAQALVAAGASVTFMGLANSAAPSLPPPEAFESRIEWRIVPGRPNPTAVALTSPLPLVSARFGTRAYAQHVKTTLRLRDFDVIILDQYAMAWAIDHIHKSGASPLIAHIAQDFRTEVTAARDFRGNLFRKGALHANARKTANAELRLARATDMIVTLTAEDAKAFARLSPLSAKARTFARLQWTARAGPGNRAGHPAVCRRCRQLSLDGQANEFCAPFSKRPIPSCKTLPSRSMLSARRG
jgi:hypothetical protein